MPLHLLKEALEDSPESLQRILMDVLDLPQKQREELAQLLERTSLSAIINASKIVSDRLDFLSGLELLIYDPENKGLLKERSQLHKILENETWIFGEEYFLSISDKSLEEVLIKHRRLLGMDLNDDVPVSIEGKDRAIVDLMLSKKVKSNYGEELHHLVVELKRPSQKIDENTCVQIEEYALAVAADERFHSGNVRWSFWAVSNDISPFATKKANQRESRPGLLYDDNTQELKVWIKTWAEIINSCKNRLKFFQDRLSYSVDEESALDYLRKLHNKYLPEALKSDQKHG